MLVMVAEIVTLATVPVDVTVTDGLVLVT